MIRPIELKISVRRILEFDISNSGSAPFGFFSHHELNLVYVRLTLPAPRDRHEVCTLKLLDEFVHSRFAHAHIGAEAVLAGKAIVLVPGVVKEHRIGDFGAEA